MTCGVYKLESPSGKFYIGSSVACEKRMRTHASLGLSGAHYNETLNNAYAKYGSLTGSIVLVCRPEDRIMYEQVCIDALKPAYNRSRRAGTVEHTAESKAKIAASKRGIPRSEAVKAKLRAANSGRVHTVDALAKMSAAQKGRRKSPEHCAKIGLAQRRRVEVRCLHCDAPFMVIRCNAGVKKFCGNRCYHLSRVGQRHKPETLAKMSATRKQIWAATPRAPKVKIPAAPRVMSDETKEKLRAAAKGRRHTPEAKAKMSAARKGKSPSAAHRASLSRALTGRKASEEQRAKRMLQSPPTLGMRHTDETKARQSAARKLAWESPEYRDRVIAGLRAQCRA